MIKFTLTRLEAQDGLNVKAPSHNYLAVVPYLISWSPNVLFPLEYGIRSHFEVIDVHAAFFFLHSREHALGRQSLRIERSQGKRLPVRAVSARTAMIGRCIGNRH
ncbi:MAG: hypothetical protein WB764_12750 [Xanthobacteraceae bacterium]